LAAVVALSGSAASAAAVLLAPVVLPVRAVLLVAAVPVPVHELQLPVLARPVLAQVLPQPLLLDLLLLPLSFRLPRVVVESEGRVHLQGRQSSSAATARSSPRTGKPT
jgi:hypothetical protein